MILESVLTLLKVDEMIAFRTSYNSFLRKVIPRPRAYRHEKYEYTVSPTLKMVLDRRDYTQWRIFAGLLRINTRIFQYFMVKPYSFTMIDVGANVGGYSVFFSREINVDHFNIHVFEPNPLISSALKENMTRLERSDLSVNVTVNFEALGDSIGTMPLKVIEGHSGVSTLGFTRGPVSRTVDVNVTTIDDYVVEKKFTGLDFIKIDAEAFEPAIIRGAMETISRFRPTIYFEYSRSWFDNFSDNYVSTVFTYLSSLGYVFLREDADGKLHYFVINNDTLKEHRHLNFLAVIRYDLREFK